jgi:hypothetical protein
MKLGRTSRCTLFIFGLLLSFTSLGAFAQMAPKVYHLGVLSPSSGTVERLRRLMLPELAKLRFCRGRQSRPQCRGRATGRIAASSACPRGDAAAPSSTESIRSTTLPTC